MKRKRVAILGSTGSIGTQALDVIGRHEDRFEVAALAAGRNVELLKQQAQQFGADIAVSAHDGPDALVRAASQSHADIVLCATDGAVAFDAAFAAVERGIALAVANKELIVAAGELLMAAAARSGAAVLPVDSEHSAIFQCLVGESRERVAEIVLTASGGPFWRSTREEIETATIERALAHPTWRMGTKNTIDSATMMNKGLEVIEASRLFGIDGERIRIVVHPQSIVHGFVAFTDGSLKAQLAAPDMRVPIGYALAYPDRLAERCSVVPSGAPAPVDMSGAPAPVVLSGASAPVVLSGASAPVVLSGASEASAVEECDGTLRALGATAGAAHLRYDFEPPDPERFPCVALAYRALGEGGTAPATLSAANEVAVKAFVEGKIAFGEIAAVVEAALDAQATQELTLAAVRAADRAARAAAEKHVARIERSSCR